MRSKMIPGQLRVPSESIKTEIFDLQLKDAFD